jgi:hypothetical protein
MSKEQMSKEQPPRVPMSKEQLTKKWFKNIILL